MVYLDSPPIWLPSVSRASVSDLKDMDEFYNLFNRDSILMCFGQLASIGTWGDEVI